VFPDNANVCDQHGVVLEPIAGTNWLERARRHRVAIAGAAVGLVGIAATPSLLAWHVSRNVRIELAAAELRKSSGKVQAKAPANRFEWLADKSVVVRIRARNRSFVTLALKAARYRVTVSSIKAAEGAWAGGGESVQPLAPGGSTELLFWIPLKDGALRHMFLNPPEHGYDVTAEGDADVLVFGRAWRVPFRARMILTPKMDW
jgi:hypothetical protein